MRISCKLIFLICFFGVFIKINAQQSTSNVSDSCSCSAVFDQLISKIENNYIGYQLEFKGKNDVKYRQQVKLFEQRARLTPNDKCILVLQDFVRFFRDGHMFVQENPKLTDEDVSRLTKNAEQTQWRTEEDVRRYLDKNTKYLDPIEGIWYNSDGQRFGIIRNYKTNRRDFIAILLTKGVERWQPGQIKAEFKKLPDNSYSNIFYSGRHYPLHLSVYSRGELGGAELRRNGLLLHIAPITWGKAYPLRPDEQDMIDPLDPRNPMIRPLGESTLVVSVPSHSPQYKPILNDLIEKFRDRISKAKNLIIDIRGNEGGGTGTTSMLMPFLVTTAKRPARYWIGGHTMVLSSPDNISYFERMESQGWIPKHLVERLRANTGKIIRFSDPDSDKDSDDTISDKAADYPRNVAILMDKAVVSAGEAFVIQAMKNNKVTLFGENSGGVLDYQSVSIISASSCSALGINLGYPMFAASEFLPRGGIKSTGIAPNVRIGQNVKDPFDFIIKYYARNTK